jgi:hypothetical protein
MKSWAFAAIFVSVAAMAGAACDGGSDTSSGSTTGGTGTGTGSGTATGSPTGSPTGTPTGTADVCDAAGAICGDATDPTTCLGCAIEGDCKDEFDICTADQECIDYVNCLDPCMDQACADACDAMFPNGSAEYNDLAVCAVCEVCPVSCDAAMAGCP